MLNQFHHSPLSAVEEMKLCKVAEALECQHEWIPRQDYGLDICRRCKVTRATGAGVLNYYDRLQ